MQKDPNQVKTNFKGTDNVFTVKLRDFKKAFLSFQQMLWLPYLENSLDYFEKYQMIPFLYNQMISSKGYTYLSARAMITTFGQQDWSKEQNKPRIT